MNQSIRLCLVLHNHQPIGNFEDVFEQAYQDSYLPFLEVFEPYQHLSISLHMSGPLAEWLDQHHSDYMDRIRALVLAGRIEMVGGGFYEPILTMLPSRDRIGQVKSYTEWLQAKFDARVQGAWVAERVWESVLTNDLATAGINYTILDDFHFRQAGLTEDQLHGFYIAEDAGKTLRVFPGSEPLRYLIPFAEPEKTIEHLREMAIKHPGTVAVFGDDGEKFGTWPETHQHVYRDGWLKKFLDALDEQRDWLITSTLADAVEHTAPLGKVYLPDASYREMTEWAQPVPRQLEYDQIKHDLEETDEGKRTLSYVRGGFWRNFKIRYPETNEMYCRMMYVSQLLDKARKDQADPRLIAAAEKHLYRGQCNCAYWHGAFGGLYLPHLRNAVFAELIEAEKIIEQGRERAAGWAEASADDFNFDGRPEIRMANERQVVWVSPGNGGHLYEWDIREINHNLLATIDRGPEAYHEKVKQGENQHADEAASIHDRVVFKQADLDQKLQYDTHRRKSLIDHFWGTNVSLDQVIAGQADELADFSTAPYQSRIRRSADRVQVQLFRSGQLGDAEISLTKAVTMIGGQEKIEIAYLLEGIPAGAVFCFGVEFNFSGLPAGADDRFFHFGDSQSAGQLQTRLDTDPVEQIHLTDQWLGVDCGLQIQTPTRIWTYPIESVSQSEAGFESVHQSVVVLPHWRIEGDTSSSWSVKMELDINTEMARSRKPDDSVLAQSRN